jgi:hypothetical protein
MARERDKLGVAMWSLISLLFLGVAAVILHFWVAQKLEERRAKKVRNDALAVLSGIRPEMTFDEISKIVPITTNSLPFMTSSSGIAYETTVGPFSVHLHFESQNGRYPTVPISGSAKLDRKPGLNE